MTCATRLLLAFGLSGGSGLVYEVIWTRQLATLVGATAHASQAVLATFFAGLMAGAFLLGRRVARARQGARAYAALEVAIAAAGLASVALLGLARGPVAALTDGRAGVGTAAVALAVTAIACLPATLLMGATFPALTRALEPHRLGAAPQLLGRAYAANTAGAVLGSLGAAFVALPLVGVTGTLAVAILGNLLAAALALTAPAPRDATDLNGGRPISVAPEPSDAPARGDAAASGETTPVLGAATRGALPRPLAAALALAGFAAIALQIVAIRILAVTLADTFYTFAVAVAVYIAGAALAASLVARTPIAALPPGLTLALAALASALWLPTLRLAGPLHALVTGDGIGFAGTIAAEALIAIFVALPAAVPTTCVYMALAARPEAGAPADAAGRATAWNGVGCALAPIASALLLLPWGGTILVAAAAIGALAAAAVTLLARAPGRQRLLAGGCLAGALLVVVAVRGGLHGFVVTPGWRLLWAAEGATATVSIEESPAGARRLRTNNNFAEGGDGGSISQLRQGMLPTLLRPDAERVLVLGVGSGITLAGAVAGLPQARFDAVELLPEIRHALGAFARSNGGVAERPNVALHVADARVFAAHAARRGARYDLVIGELFHAQQAGTGALYAREHFETVARLLSPDGGLFCQWLPLHEAPPEQVRTIVRTFFRVFPEGAAFLGGWALHTPLLVLVGGQAPPALDWEATAARLAAPPERAQRAATTGLDQLAQTFSTHVADAAALRAWAGGGADNSDERPIVELEAPRGKGRPLAEENLMAILPLWRVPDGLVAWGDPARRTKVARLQEAAAAFFQGSRAWRLGDLPQADAQLRAAYERGPSLPFIVPALRGLATQWKEGGEPDRAVELLAWLERAHGAGR